ncbi:MAG: type transport system ATP-binding protein, partial [Bacteroidota bacterium]|nr:type transport system ATP-binding protein [Bacteroidota bacterium]
PFMIEAGISFDSAVVPDSGGKVFKEEQLTDALKNINGVLSVNLENNVFQIGCSHNLAAEIAKVIVVSGAGLNFLYKKEYGLNEIYNRYFEGGE